MTKLLSSAAASSRNPRVSPDGDLEDERQLLVEEQKLCRTRALKFSVETNRRLRSVSQSVSLWCPTQTWGEQCFISPAHESVPGLSTCERWLVLTGFLQSRPGNRSAGAGFTADQRLKPEATCVETKYGKFRLNPDINNCLNVSSCMYKQELKALLVWD